MTRCISLAMNSVPSIFIFFFFNDTATTEIYTLSLHDALPISHPLTFSVPACVVALCSVPWPARSDRSEEHTSELQSLAYLVCRLLLEKKKKNNSFERTSPNRSMSITTLAGND